MTNSISVNVNFSPQAFKAMEEIADELGVTNAEVLRRALGLMRFAVRERAHGARLIVKGPGWGMRREIVGL